MPLAQVRSHRSLCLLDAVYVLPPTVIPDWLKLKQDFTVEKPASFSNLCSANLSDSPPHGWPLFTLPTCGYSKSSGGRCDFVYSTISHITPYSATWTGSALSCSGEWSAGTISRCDNTSSLPFFKRPSQRPWQWLTYRWFRGSRCLSTESSGSGWERQDKMWILGRKNMDCSLSHCIVPPTREPGHHTSAPLMQKKWLYSRLDLKRGMTWRTSGTTAGIKCTIQRLEQDPVVYIWAFRMQHNQLLPARTSPVNCWPTLLSCLEYRLTRHLQSNILLKNRTQNSRARVLTSSENLNHLKEKERIKDEATKERPLRRSRKKRVEAHAVAEKKAKEIEVRKREKEECRKGDKQVSCTLQVHT